MMPNKAEAAYVSYMKAALKLAAKGLGNTSPNPAVGALVVRGGKVVGRGYHRAAGTPHAEVHALDEAGSLAKGAKLFVTLEPCCHFGRTPPCVDRVIASGVKEVIVGAIDPNPRVSGKGVKALRKAGIDVTTGVLEPACSRLNESYNKFITTGLPFVILKLAATLDGKIAAKTGKSKWITGQEARKLVHRMRSEVDAVLVGAGTVLADDPELTVRHVKGKNPVRIVIDPELRVPVSAKVFKPEGRLIIIASRDANPAKVRAAKKSGAQVLTFKSGKRGISFKPVLRKLATLGITSIIIEGGSDTAGRAVEQGVVDKAAFFIAPSVMGGDGKPMIGPLGLSVPAVAARLNDVNISRVGDDILIEGYF